MQALSPLYSLFARLKRYIDRTILPLTVFLHERIKNHFHVCVFQHRSSNGNCCIERGVVRRYSRATHIVATLAAHTAAAHPRYWETRQSRDTKCEQYEVYAEYSAPWSAQGPAR